MQHVGEASKRVSTGSLQLGNDYPGYFVRGDEALGMAGTMKLLANAIERGDEGALKVLPHYLRNLASQFETCRKKDAA